MLEEGGGEKTHYSSGGLAVAKYSCPEAEEEEFELAVVAVWAVKVVKIA